MSQTSEAVGRRLDRLERENCWLKMAVMAIVVLGGAAVVMGQAAPKGKTIEAKEIVLKDDDGDTRVLLATTKSGAALDLYDADGNRGVRLYIGRKGPGIHFGYAKDEIRMGIGVGEDGAGIDFYDPSPSNEQRLSIGFTDDGRPGLNLRDPKGNVQAWLTGGQYGPALVLYDKNKNIRVMLSSSEQGGDALTLLDADQSTRAEMRLDGGEPHLLFKDAEGEMTWSAP